MSRLGKLKRQAINEANIRVLNEKQYLMEGKMCQEGWETVELGLENSLNKSSSIDITSNICAKDQTEFIKGEVSGIKGEKVKCIHNKISEWCETKGYTYVGPKQEVTTTNTTKDTKQIKKFKVVNSNKWNRIPEQVKGYLLFPNYIELRSHLIPYGDQLKTYYENNTDKFTDNGYATYVVDSIMYLIPINYDDGQTGAGNIDIEKGTKDEFDEFYGGGKSPQYNTLPEGSTDYLIIKKENDVNRSFLIALKNGTPCLNLLFKQFSSKYGDMSKCWGN